MVRRVGVIAGVVVGVFVLVPVTVGAITGNDALLGLQEVLKLMLEAYVEFLKALA